MAGCIVAYVLNFLKLIQYLKWKVVMIETNVFFKPKMQNWFYFYIPIVGIVIKLYDWLAETWMLILDSLSMKKQKRKKLKIKRLKTVQLESKSNCRRYQNKARKHKDHDYHLYYQRWLSRQNRYKFKRDKLS